MNVALAASCQGTQYHLKHLQALQLCKELQFRNTIWLMFKVCVYQLCVSVCIDSWGHAKDRMMKWNPLSETNNVALIYSMLVGSSLSCQHGSSPTFKKCQVARAKWGMLSHLKSLSCTLGHWAASCKHRRLGEHQVQRRVSFGDKSEHLWSWIYRGSCQVCYQKGWGWLRWL